MVARHDDGAGQHSKNPSFLRLYGVAAFLPPLSRSQSGRRKCSGYGKDNRYQQPSTGPFWVLSAKFLRFVSCHVEMKWADLEMGNSDNVYVVVVHEPESNCAVLLLLRQPELLVVREQQRMPTRWDAQQSETYAPPTDTSSFINGKL